MKTCGYMQLPSSFDNSTIKHILESLVGHNILIFSLQVVGKMVNKRQRWGQTKEFLEKNSENKNQAHI